MKMLVDEWIQENNLKDNYSIQDQGRGAYTIKALADEIINLQKVGDSNNNIELMEAVIGDIGHECDLYTDNL